MDKRVEAGHVVTLSERVVPVRVGVETLVGVTVGLTLCGVDGQTGASSSRTKVRAWHTVSFLQTGGRKQACNTIAAFTYHTCGTQKPQKPTCRSLLQPRS